MLSIEESEVPPGCGVMAYMTEKDGDVKLIWDRSRPAEVKSCRTQFDELRKQGYLAYKVKGDGSTGKQIFEFDPDAERIILIPAVQGG